jgi:hypothetical protein
LRFTFIQKRTAALHLQNPLLIVSVTVVVFVKPPPVPDMVTVVVPMLARELTVNLRVDFPVPVMEAGLKLAVTLAGRPPADKVTAESNVPVTVLVIVVLPELPLRTLTEVGEALSVKPPFTGAVTVSVTEVVLVMVPLGPVPEPVMVMGYVPGAALKVTVKVSTELPLPGAAMTLELGAKLTVTPVGREVGGDKVISELKPFKAAVVMVEVPVFPCTTEIELGEAEMEKLGVAGPASLLSRAAPFILPHPVAKS